MTNLADELFATVRAATRVLYPEARIPETPMGYDPHHLSETEQARLQRCAPGLYEALEALVNASDGHPGSARQREAARAVLAAARNWCPS